MAIKPELFLSVTTLSKYDHIKEVRTPMKKISETIKSNVTAHDLRRTFKEIATLASWIVEQARIVRANNVIPMADRKKA